MAPIQLARSAVETGVKLIDPRPQGKQSYTETLHRLSEASTTTYFNAFEDIDWDSPDFEVTPDDDRWVLSEKDELGRHPWYQALPRERQIEIGMYRYANMCRTGRQFEQLLIAGLAFYLNKHVGNDDPEYRYANHEMTEETHHTQMFQELVNRTGTDVQGAPTWLVNLIPPVAWIAALFPELFFLVVLAGEEPIDHVQKDTLRTGKDLHPMLERVVQIHIAEEARHIGFAHAYLTEKVPRLDPVRRNMLALAFPIILRLGVEAIAKPTKQAQQDMGIPDEVLREIWWDAPESRKVLRDLFSDVRQLSDELGLRGRVPRMIWRLMKIDGRPSRFRAEPPNAAA